MSEWYERYERFEISSVLTCVQMTDVSLKSGPVIEVACGPGLHSEVIAKSFLRGNGSMLVSCDFSQNMVEKLKQRYAQSDFTQIEGNKFLIDTEKDYANPEVTQRVDLQSLM